MKKILLPMLFAAAVLGAAETPANLLKDPGGEEQSRAWYMRGKSSGKDPERLRFLTDAPHSGKYCIRVMDRTDQDGQYLSQRVKLPADAKILKLTFWARADEPHEFVAGMLINAPQKCTSASKLFKAEKAWQKFTLTAHLPEDASSLDLLVCPTRQQSNYPLTGTVYVDDFSLTVVPPPTPAEVLGIDREPAPRGDAPYQPADGSTVMRNPPSFTFPAVLNWAPGKFTYAVEWSQDPAFPEAKTGRMTGEIYHVIIPDKVLAPGKWYWRYGVENQKGKTEWSKARSFTVPADVPQQAWIPIDELVKRISKEDLRSYITRDQLPKIRERAKSGDLKPLADSLKKYLTPLIGKELQEEPPFLSKDPKQRTQDFVRIMRSMTFHRMRAFALAYILTGDVKYGNEAKRQLLHFYGKWDPRGSTSVKHNDEPGMHINSHGLSAYEFTRELFTPEERKIVEESMRIRMLDFYDVLSRRAVDAHPYNSHAIYYFQLLGRLGLVLVHSYPEDAKKCIDFSLRFFWTYLHPFAFEDGGWSEGPAYGSWGIERLCRYTHVVRMTTGQDMQKIHPFFKYCGYFPLYGWPGRSRQTSFGDGTSPGNQADMLRICSALNDNPVFLKPGVDRKTPLSWSIWPVLLDRDVYKEPDMSKLPKAYHFPSIGFAALRTDLADFDNDVGLIFQSNPVGAVSHHHNSHNCFGLEAYSEPLAISSGYYDYYSSPHHAGWTRETKSRCGITVDGGKGQMRGGHSTGKLTKFVNGADFDVVEGDASPAYDMLDTAVRTIVHVRPGIFVIRDRAKGPKPHVFEYNLHSFQPGAFDEAAQTVTLKAPKAECLVKFFAAKPWKFRSFDKFPIEPQRDPKRPYPEQWHFVASSPEPEAALDLITVLLPYRTGEAAKLPKVEKLADGVRLTYADGHTATVRFNGDKVLTEKK